ncbi:uncharacterized protein LOC128960380 [Oppia nitens]|uniref:uncharacterized protein LOC128960380 n=1 Tax=Oppia nitens TaxID=1686743 RepID=UPI0023DCA260|nr:uncharacterized protein LOC128960380 [Oppia nitens]
MNINDNICVNCYNEDKCNQKKAEYPIVVVQRLSQSEINKYLNEDKQLITKLNEIDLQKELDIKSIESSDYMKCLNLIPTTDLNNQSLNQLKQSFPLRRINRIDGLNIDLETNQVIGNKEQILRENGVIVDNVFRNHEIKVKTKKKFTIRKKRRSKGNKNKVNTIDEEVKQKHCQKTRLSKFVSTFDITSEMFRFLSTTLQLKQLSQKEISMIANKRINLNSYPKNQMIAVINETNSWNNWKCIDIYHKIFESELREKYQRNAFYYTFSRRQRLERSLRLKTGIDWKSRLDLSQCKPFSLEMSAITKCHNCLETIDLWHSCHRYAKVDRQSDTQPISPQSSDYCIDFECNLNVESTEVPNKELIEVKNQKDSQIVESVVVIQRNPSIDAMAIKLSTIK